MSLWNYRAIGLSLPRPYPVLAGYEHATSCHPGGEPLASPQYRGTNGMKKDKRPSVLLLDALPLPCLAFTRSLGRAGISVTVASESPDASTRVSRYGTKFPICPSPLREPEAFRHWLFRTLSQEHFDLLVGMTDQTVFLLQEWREQLGQLVDVPLAPREAFQLAWDNAATVKLAQELGIPTPRTFFYPGLGRPGTRGAKPARASGDPAPSQH